MRNVALALTVLLLSVCPVVAQSRMRIVDVNVTPVPTPVPTPTPAPLPGRPDGLYVGPALGSIGNGPNEGTNYNFGQWSFSIISDSCSDCDPGQYELSLQAYSGITYTDGTRETGNASGYVNPSGRMISFSMIANNCLQVNPSGTVIAAGSSLWPTGFYEGGELGFNSGATLTLHQAGNGFNVPTIVGSISGRDCFGQVITAYVQLQKR